MTYGRTSREVNLATGNTDRSQIIHDRVNWFEDTFKDIPEYEQVKLFVSDSISTTLYDSLLYLEQSYKKLVGVKTILFAPSTPDNVVFTGQYIRPETQVGTYMLVSSDEQYPTKRKGIVIKCTETLRWYDEDGNLREFPVVVMNSYRKGLNEDKYMVLTSGQYIVGIPQNEVTFKLQEGNEFILNKKHKYRIAGFEDIESDTFMTVTLDKYEENASTDDLENGIANFADRPRFTLTLDTDASEFSIGNDIQIQYTLLDKDGQPSLKEVVYSSSDESVCTVSDTGLATAISNGNATITVAMKNNSDVSDTVVLSVVDTPVSMIEYLLDNESLTLLRNQSRDYTAIKKNNGVIESETYAFSIINDSTSNSDYVFTVIDGDTFRLQNKTSSGELSVMVIPQGDVGNQFVRVFTMKSGYR